MFCEFGSVTQMYHPQPFFRWRVQQHSPGAIVEVDAWRYTPPYQDSLSRFHIVDPERCPGSSSAVIRWHMGIQQPTNPPNREFQWLVLAMIGSIVLNNTNGNGTHNKSTTQGFPMVLAIIGSTVWNNNIGYDVYYKIGLSSTSSGPSVF